MDRIERYHCCATCKYFEAKKENGKLITRCIRLGYETKPSYRFRCWNPKSNIKERIERNPNGS